MILFVLSGPLPPDNFRPQNRRSARTPYSTTSRLTDTNVKYLWLIIMIHPKPPRVALAASLGKSHTQGSCARARSPKQCLHDANPGKAGLIDTLATTPNRVALTKATQ